MSPTVLSLCRVTIAPLLIASLCCNVILLMQYRAMQHERESVSSGTSSQLTGIDPTYFGLYTYAGFGAWLVPEGPDGRRARAPLTLNVFLSSRSECPALTSELEILGRLLPVLESRGQRMIANCESDDSIGVQAILRDGSLSIPLLPIAFEDSDVTLADLGISPLSMPFKIIYDSTFSAIYVRGADNTPESQADFERAVLRLSRLVHEGKL